MYLETQPYYVFRNGKYYKVQPNGQVWFEQSFGYKVNKTSAITGNIDNTINIFYKIRGGSPKKNFQSLESTWIYPHLSEREKIVYELHFFRKMSLREIESQCNSDGTKLKYQTAYKLLKNIKQKIKKWKQSSL